MVNALNIIMNIMSIFLSISQNDEEKQLINQSFQENCSIDTRDSLNEPMIYHVRSWHINQYP